MPGHFTHIYTARRVQELLSSETFTDWPDLGAGGDAVAGLDPKTCGDYMFKWQKFTAIGAIGPDLFFFSQDWNNPALEPHSDDIMLALAIYYYYDFAKENDWEPLIVILRNVDSTLANFLELVIKLQKIWDKFVDVWNKTIGPIVEVVGDLTDDLTGGVLSELRDYLTEFVNELVALGVEDVSQWAHIWDRMNTVVAKGYPEGAFLWSDMTHYRRTTSTCQALVHQAQLLRDGSDGSEDRYEQFLAFTMGWIVHVGTDTIAHSFVNEQCGGPYRVHPTRHHLIENHIDAWNYQQSGSGGTIPPDPWGRTDDYPDLSSSALWFAVQQTPDEPNGEQRPSPLSDDPDTRKEQLDVDGEMPMWMANAIVAALLETFVDHPHPLIYQGSSYQGQIDQGRLTQAIRGVTGHGLDKPFQELLDGIAPPPPFEVPVGFPLPWEVATAYRVMITAYKLFFKGAWQLPKPRHPDFIIVPPASDFTNLFQPPDFSGVDSSNPIVDACEALLAVIQWIIKEAAAVIKLIGDIIKMLVSPITYKLREAIYEAALGMWDVATKIHEVLAHTGLLMPHSEARYADNGELKWPNEIDLPLITLGGTVDGAFRQALADNSDIFGVDTDQSFIVSHSVRDERMPFYPVLEFHTDGTVPDGWEYRRPWAYPETSEELVDGVDIPTPTATELYEPRASDADAPPGPFKPMRPGPYPEGTTPDEVFFRTDAPPDVGARMGYESAQTPWQTDQLNEALIARAEGSKRVSPLGDPVPFSAYLIGRIVNDTGYETQFNLDADRAYGYLTWDWIRTTDEAHTDRTEFGLKYHLPVVAPWADLRRWNKDSAMQLYYVDPPNPIIIEARENGAQRSADGEAMGGPS